MTHTIAAICMALAALFLSFLNKQSGAAEASNGRYKMPKVYLFMGYLMVLISLGILIVPRLMPNAPENYHPIAWIAIAAIFIFGLYIMRLYAVHSVSAQGNEIEITSAFGRKQIFKLDNIQSVRLSFLTYFITITDNSGQKGKIYFHLKGLLALLKKIETKNELDIAVIERVLKM